MSRIPVFVYERGDSIGQVGNGNYGLMACFVKKGVHVPFSIYCHSENEYINSVGKATACNGDCDSYTGHMKDWSKERCDSSYTVKEIIEKANKFKARKKTKNA